MEPTSTTMTYDDALETFLAADANYGGGLANHGPMAAEALVSMGQADAIGAFVAAYEPRLEPSRRQVAPAPDDWRSWLQPQLTTLVSMAGNLAGHGLLRVAHAVRGLERAEASGGGSAVQRRELAVALDYWRNGGAGVPSPKRLGGESTADQWLAMLGRLDPEQRSDGLLTVTLAAAAETEGFRVGMAALAPSPDPASTLDVLAVTAALAFERNNASSAFALVHGVTVSSMARVLLAHLDDAGARELEAVVAGFVGAALIGFDVGEHTPDSDEPVRRFDTAALAEQGAETREDHTIKFVDACLQVTARTDDPRPLRAAHRQIVQPYGL
jgi:hypothetical protein